METNQQKDQAKQQRIDLILSLQAQLANERSLQQQLTLAVENRNSLYAVFFVCIK